MIATRQLQITSKLFKGFLTFLRQGEEYKAFLRLLQDHFSTALNITSRQHDLFLDYF